MTEAFDKLSDFILNQMRMSHIYQPVMLIEILKKNGSASTNAIAKALLRYDISQVEYYEHITKNMVGKVLTKSRGVTSKDKNQYHLNEFENLDEEEIKKLIIYCEEIRFGSIERNPLGISLEHRDTKYLNGQNSDVNYVASQRNKKH